MKKELIACDDGGCRFRLMLSETEIHGAIKIVAEAGMILYRGKYSRGLLTTIHKDMVSNYDLFMTTDGFHFTIRLGYDLHEPGDSKQAQFCIEIRQTEAGREFYKDLLAALENLGVASEEAGPSEAGG